MSKERRLDDELKIDIVYERPPSPQSTYRYEREDGTVVHGDASGEWALDANGDVEDIVFFMSPLHLMKLGQRGLVETTDVTSPSPPPPTAPYDHRGLIAE